MLHHTQKTGTWSSFTLTPFACMKLRVFWGEREANRIRAEVEAEAEAEAEAKEFHKGGLMDLRKIEDVANDSKGGLLSVEKDTLISNPSTPQNNHDIDSGTALQLFLDRIPVSSIPGINNNSSVLELKTGDSVRDAISLLYDENVFGALVADNAATDRYSDRYIGFIDFATLVLWCLEEFEKMRNENSDNGTEEMGCNATFFSILDQYPSIGQTKIGELAKSFLLDPFFPVHLDDTLFHVLLLLSKHRLQVIPVIEQSNSQVIGFITENAVMQLLLQSSGLDWFNGISYKALTEFRFENKEFAVHVYGDQNITEALHILWRSRIGVIAVRDRVNDRLIGSVRNRDVFLLLESENLIHNRKKTVEEFIHIEVNKGASDPHIKQDLGILLRNLFLPRMDSPVTNKETDTLKQVMKNMADTKSSFSFIVDDSWQATGVLTLRDMIIQFAPPCIDSSIHGVGFFESALEQTGCQVKNGTVICDR